MRADSFSLRSVLRSLLALSVLSAVSAAALAQGTPTANGLPLIVGQGAGGTSYSVPIQTLLFFTALSFIPALLLLMTGFTRIVIVLSLLRQALGTQAAPPNQVIIGLSLFLTFFVMSPTLDHVYEQAYAPFAANQIAFDEALQRGEVPMREFMLKQTRQSDVQLFAKLAKLPADVKSENVPLRVLVPAFVTSELKSAFQIGFMIFIPFLIIDMIVASVLMSLGMMMLSPGAGGPALQADAVRAGRRLEPAARLAGCFLRHLIRQLIRQLRTEPRHGRTQVLAAGQQGLYLLLMVAAPVLLTVLVVGLLVSIFQAATQINEATLSFVPKIVAAVAVLAFAGPWMMTTLVEYLQRTLQAIPAAVG